MNIWRIYIVFCLLMLSMALHELDCQYRRNWSLSKYKDKMCAAALENERNVKGWLFLVIICPFFAKKKVKQNTLEMYERSVCH